ncbi:Nn.00g031440.m01.CDS01 [Neocucurbitaria sp. VM-36]
MDEARCIGVILQLTLQLPYNGTPSTAGWFGLEHPSEATPGLVPTALYAHKIETTQVDWTTVRSWIQRCEAKHLGLGNMLPCEPPALSLSGVLLIDCFTRKIVPAPNPCKYSALSYVWGSSLDVSPQFQWTLPTPAPLVIEDAVTCTQALGLQYLWVDRYCIDQEASQMKMHQIQNMGKIYGSAAVTIISAAGEDSDCGLPGVSKKHRQPQESVTLHGKRLTMIPNVRAEVESNKWSHRGWTFQESILSNRRLVFTNSQVYFQCLNMHCCESLMTSFKSRSVVSEDNLDTALQVFPRPVHYGQQATASVRLVFAARLCAYLTRTLSTESDSLNAFMGILRYFWFLESPIYHFWGLPFGPYAQKDAPPMYDFLVSLLWRPANAPNLPSLVKKAEFPSWTWAAWKGIADIWPDPDTWRDSTDRDFDVSVAIEDISGVRLTVEAYVQRMTSTWDLYQFQPYLHLTGWMAMAYFRAGTYLNNKNEKRASTLLSASAKTKDEDCIVTMSSFWDTPITEDFFSCRAPRLSGPWPIFCFFQTKTSHYNKKMNGGLAGLILKQNADTSYMRVGVLNIYQCTKVELDDKTALLHMDYYKGHRDRYRGKVELPSEKRTIKLV